jgi:hypothetical protein
LLFGGLRHNVVYRREVRLGHLRHWWRRFPVLCVLFALAIGFWSFLELNPPRLAPQAGGVQATASTGPLLGPRWGERQSDLVTDALIFVFMVMGPLRLTQSLRRDIQSKVAESLLVTGMDVNGYLRGLLVGSVRPTFVIIFALWLRWVLTQVRFDTELGQLVGMGENWFVVTRLVYGSVGFLTRLVYGSVGFLVGALVWILGILCYSALGMFLTLRSRGTGRVIETVAVVALVVEILIPDLLRLGIEIAPARIGNTLIAATLVLALASVLVKYLLYVFFFERSEEHFSRWVLE